MARMEPVEVRTRADFSRFVAHLRAELQEQPEKWENADLDAFLEALGAAATDVPGVYRNRGDPLPDMPTWKLMAELLVMASVYE